MSRFSAFIAVAGAFLTSAAFAGIPEPTGSILGVNLPVTKRPFISIEGATNGLPDNCSENPQRCADYTVEIRDFANNAIAGSTVVIDFSGCCDIQIACDQLTAVTGQSYIADGKVQGSTNAAGQFTFRVQGAANSTTSNLPSPQQSHGIPLGFACARVYADGYPLGSLKVSAYDIDGIGSPSNAVSASDLETVNAEISRGNISGTHYQRTDINADGSVDSLDASLMVDMVLDQMMGTGSTNTAPYCRGSVSCVPLGVPGEWAVSTSNQIHAAPNPFLALTTVEFALAETQDVQMGVYDVAGRQVRLLHRERLGAGVHRLDWDGLDVSGHRSRNGIYFIRMKRGGTESQTKVILLR